MSLERTILPEATAGVPQEVKGAGFAEPRTGRLSRRSFLGMVVKTGLGLGLAVVLGSERQRPSSAAETTGGQPDVEPDDNVIRLIDAGEPVPYGLLAVDELASQGSLRRIFQPGFFYSEPLEGSSPWLISGVVTPDPTRGGADNAIYYGENDIPYIRLGLQTGNEEVLINVPLWDIKDPSKVQAFSVWNDSTVATRPVLKVRQPEEVWVLQNYVRPGRQVIIMVQGSKDEMENQPQWVKELSEPIEHVITRFATLFIVPSGE